MNLTATEQQTPSWPGRYPGHPWLNERTRWNCAISDRGQMDGRRNGAAMTARVFDLNAVVAR